MVELVLNGFRNIFYYPVNLIIMTIGVAAGIIVGATPGLSATMAISVLLPVIYSMGPQTGLILLGAVWVGAVYGGANSAILINVPGAPAAIATTFDGYPMTLKGESDEALHTALVVSVIGGLLGSFVLMFLFGPLAIVSLRIGPSEYMWLAVMGLTTIAALSTGDLINGLIGGAIGILLSTIGMDPIYATQRLTFGNLNLAVGVELIPATLGIFCFAQALFLLEENSEYITDYKPGRKILQKIMPSLIRNWFLIIKSSAIGILVGMLPGAGAQISTLIAYNEARRSDPHPETFGKGNIKGVIATESCNNATIEGALIPMLGLGIPGNVVSAIIMGVLFSFGIQPGVKLLEESGDIVYTFIVSLIVSNLLMLPVGLCLIKLIAKVLKLRTLLLAPSIIAFSIIGSYAAIRSMYGVGVMLTMGIMAYLLVKAGIQRGPIILGLVLGKIAEINFLRAYQISQIRGVWSSFFFRPISMIFILFCIIIILNSTYIERKKEALRESLKTR